MSATASIEPLTAARPLRGGLAADRRIGGAAFAGALWLVGFAAATAVVDDDGPGGRIMGDVVYVVPVALAAALTVLAARRLRGSERPFWILLALANVAWLCGELTWSILELGLGREIPFPSLADVFYLGVYVFAVPAVLLGLRRSPTAPVWRALSDASVLAAALGLAGFSLLIEPQLEQGRSLATAVGIVYPVFDVVILVLLVTAAVAQRGAPVPIVLVAWGFAVASVTDAGYTYLSVVNGYTSGSWLNLGWQAQAVLFSLAAVVAIRTRGSAAAAAETAPRDTGMPIVLAGVAIAGSVIGADVVRGDLGPGSALLGALTVAAVVFRLHVTSRQHEQAARHLARSLAKRQVAEEELQRTLSLVRATLDSTADGILVVDRAGAIVGQNRRFQEMWRIPDEVMESRDDAQAIAVVLDQLADPDAFLAKIAELYADPDAESFDTLAFRDGRTFERYAKPQRLGGESVGRVWSFRDVTERRSLEEQLRQAQRMESIGRLAGGVAHDFNNLLTAITGYSELLVGKLDGQEAPLRDAAEIRRAADRAASLTRQLLAFSRKQLLQPKLVDLNAVVADMEQLLRPLIGEDVLLEVMLAPDPGLTRVDPGQLEQVIVNLAVNARDAMPGGGTITIGTAGEDDAVLLTVSDTGCGMDAETSGQAFEPFFTTKPAGEGTGLGLSTVFGIVEQSGGSVEVASAPGEGALFTVRLPRAAGEVAERPAAEARSVRVRASETVLLVEDETIVRDLVHEVLESDGYEVLAAEDGESALRVANTHPGEIDLLLTDVVMPGMSGRELADSLAPLRPGMQVVYMSGYTEDAVVHRGVREAETHFLAKPFTIEQLASRLRLALDRP